MSACDLFKKYLNNDRVLQDLAFIKNKNFLIKKKKWKVLISKHSSKELRMPLVQIVCQPLEVRVSDQGVFGSGGKQLEAVAIVNVFGITSGERLSHVAIAFVGFLHGSGIPKLALAAKNFHHITAK